MIKKCCILHCSNERVTFEDSSIFRHIKRSNDTYFGFICQTCKNDIQSSYMSCLDRGVQQRPPDICISSLAFLEIGEDLYPSHAQSRLAMLLLAPDPFYSPDIGFKIRSRVVVYCRPPDIFSNKP